MYLIDACNGYAWICILIMCKSIVFAFCMFIYVLNMYFNRYIFINRIWNEFGVLNQHYVPFRCSDWVRGTLHSGIIDSGCNTEVVSSRNSKLQAQIRNGDVELCFS